MDVLEDKMQEFRGTERGRDLIDRTIEKAKKPISGLLDELISERGVGWSDLADVVGVSISEIRKWPKGKAASPESALKLARIAALLDVLEEKAFISDPAVWMEMDLPLEPGYFIRPLDLYLEGHVLDLMDLAEQRLTVSQVLDKVRPNWRINRSDFEVFVDTDGERSIRQFASA